MIEIILRFSSKLHYDNFRKLLAKLRNSDIGEPREFILEKDGSSIFLTNTTDLEIIKIYKAFNAGIDSMLKTNLDLIKSNKIAPDGWSDKMTPLGEVFPPDYDMDFI